MTRPARLLANGQTGVALGALRAGLILGIPTGGVMPRGFTEYECSTRKTPTGRVKLRTTRTSRPYYGQRYGLVEGVEASLTAADRMNIRLADVTVVIGDSTVPRNRLLARIAGDMEKPCWQNPAPDRWATEFAGRVVHLCGNRESSLRGVEAWVVHTLVAAWGTPELLAQHPLPKYLPRIR